MPVYNRQDYLSTAIESIQAQTYPDWELILWDDQSTDRSLEIARHFSLQMPGFEWWPLPIRALVAL
jgi:glycosyltransferase involved in cell wall biosynthesis